MVKVGAAVLGVPVKPTIKEVDSEGRVVKTLQRAMLWEVQTPQVTDPRSLLQLCVIGPVTIKHAKVWMPSVCKTIWARICCDCGGSTFQHVASTTW